MNQHARRGSAMNQHARRRSSSRMFLTSQLPTLIRKEREKQHSVFQAHGPDVVSDSLLDISTSKRGKIIPEREGGQPDERSSELIIAGTYNQREHL